MPFDGITLSAVANELNAKLRTARVTKVFQPESNLVIVRLRRPAATHDLLISAHPSFPRVHLTTRSYANPQSPPPFCMVMRKYLEGRQYLFSSQVGLDRILRIAFGNGGEFPETGLSETGLPGAPERYSLYAELTGRTSNIVLVDDSSNKVLGAAKLTDLPAGTSGRTRSSGEDDTTAGGGARQIAPGAFYEPPPAQDKVELLESDPEKLELAILRSDPGLRVDKALMAQFSGFGPLTGKEICQRAGLGGLKVGNMTPEDRKRLSRELVALSEDIRKGNFAPTLLKDSNGEPVDVSPIALTHVPSENTVTCHDGISQALDLVFGEKHERQELSRTKSELSRIVSAAITRIQRKKEKQQQELEQSEKADLHRLYGELLMANLHSVAKGQSSVTLVNYYSPDGTEVTVPLAPDKSPVENAQAHFKRYRKLKNAHEHLERQIRLNQNELDYLERALTLIELADTMEDIAGIRSELEAEGYLRKRRSERPKSGKPNRLPPLSFVSSDGFEILVGRNNLQNDVLTTRIASPSDIWLHTQKIHGSHVILRTAPDAEPTATALREAASLAAFYSRARQSANVPVDYTRRKHVRKPSGSRPGFVVYDNQKTIYVDPDPGLVRRLAKGRREK